MLTNIATDIKRFRFVFSVAKLLIFYSSFLLPKKLKSNFGSGRTLNSIVVSVAVYQGLDRFIY